MTPGKVYEWSKFQKVTSNKIRFPKNFQNPYLFHEIRELIFILVLNVYKTKMLTIEIEDGREPP